MHPAQKLTQHTAQDNQRDAQSGQLANLVFRLRQDPIVLYLSEAKSKPLTPQYIRGLLATRAIEYLSDRIFVADDATLAQISGDRILRQLIYKHAGNLNSEAKQHDLSKTYQAAQLLTAFFQRGVNLESERQTAVSAQCVLYTLQMHDPKSALQFASTALKTGCQFRDSVLAHTLLSAEKLVTSTDELDELVQFACLALRSGIFTTSSYRVTFETLLNKLSDPNPLGRRLAPHYPAQESFLQVGSRLLMAHKLAEAFIDTGVTFDQGNNKLLMNNLVRSLASYPLAFAVERLQFHNQRQHKQYLSISDKLGIDFKRNILSSENLFDEMSSQVMSDTLRSSWRLANACIAASTRGESEKSHYELNYELISSSLNQIFASASFVKHVPDLRDCLELTELLRASLVIPKTRERLHSDHIQDLVLSFLNSPEIAAQLKSEAALEVSALALQMKRAPGDRKFFQRVIDVFQEHRIREHPPLIPREDDLRPQFQQELLPSLVLLQSFVSRPEHVQTPPVQLRGGLD